MQRATLGVVEVVTLVVCNEVDNGTLEAWLARQGRAAHFRHALGEGSWGYCPPSRTFFSVATIAFKSATCRPKWLRPARRFALAGTISTNVSRLTWM